MRPERGKRIAALALAATVGSTAVVPGAVAEEPAAIRPSDAKTGTERLIETLSARLLAAHSATAVLEAWCAERGLATDPHLTAVRVPGRDKPLSAAQRERLQIGPDEPVRYRRVRLTCGGHVLSEADNWYVPGRLTPEMNTVLETTQTPFGRVVHPLLPSRRNLSLKMLWTPTEAEPPGPERKLFFVEAVLSTAAGLPFCEVAETYTGAVLARGEH
ncbi:hypothetical protein [Methylobacterium gnaphalii]|uniref:hypothetical protein n=1 Tax=Methylobacterium gnaphalii TaxID=1010610 RepID=UPI001EE30ADF|nr:hypothetical protein [Methylobacterium gnaphalii]